MSIDLTVPVDGRIGWDGTPGTTVIPLAHFDKGPLRDFDITDADGRALSVLGLTDSAVLALQVVVFLLQEIDDVVVDEALLDALLGIVMSEASGADLANDLYCTGQFDGRPVLDDGARDRVGLVTWTLIDDLATGYFLFALVPEEFQGHRQVVKFSTYSTVEDLEWLSVIRGSLGVDPAELKIPVNGIGDAESYHLELHLPAEIECAQLELPAAGHASGGRIERPHGPVPHVHGSYPDRRFGTQSKDAFTAYAALTTTSRGTSRVAAMTAVVTSAFFVLGLTLPGAQDVLRTSGDPSTLLLALPAALLTIFLGVREHALASTLLGPIRVVIGACAALLALSATSLSWGLRDPWFTMFWWTGLATSTAAAVAVCFGLLLRWLRRR